MLFSCCCARVSRAWKPVCNCYKDSNYQCEESCVENSILQEELYYDHALVCNEYDWDLLWIDDQTLGIIQECQWPISWCDNMAHGPLAWRCLGKHGGPNLWCTDRDIWKPGWSSRPLSGYTYRMPLVSLKCHFGILVILLTLFSLASAQQVLVTREWTTSHTSIDIIGTDKQLLVRRICHGDAMSHREGKEKQWDTIGQWTNDGQICVWDTVNEHGWRVDIRSHRVADVIENILKKSEDFPMPRCIPEQTDCQDCGLWDFVDRRDTPRVEIIWKRRP